MELHDPVFETAQRMLMVNSRDGALHVARDMVVRGPVSSVGFWKRVAELIEVLPTHRRLNGFAGEKSCSCGIHYTPEAWDELPLLAHWVIPPEPEDDFPGEVYELKNCPKCGSTMAQLEPFTGAAVEWGTAVEKMNGVVTEKQAQQIAISNLKRDPNFYG